MYLDAGAAGYEAEYVVSEDGIAAGGHLIVQPLYVAGVEHQYVFSVRVVLERSLPVLGCLDFFFGGGCLFLHEGFYVVHIYLSGGDGCHERHYRLVAAGLDELCKEGVGELEFPVAQAPFQDSAALGGLFALVGIQLQLDFAAGLAGDYPGQPVAGGALALAGEYLYRISGLELLFNLHRLAVNQGSAAP